MLGACSILLLAPSQAQVPQFSSSEAKSHYEKAVALSDRSEWRGAMLELTHALKYEPNNAGIFVELGIAWGGLKEWDKAKETLQRAVKLAPNSVRAHYNLAVTLDRANPGHHLGISEYRKALKIDPTDVGSLVNLASDIGDLDPAEARSLLAKARSIDPKNAWAHFNLALLLKNSGDRQGAIKGIQKAIELEPESVEFRRQLVPLLLSVGKSDEAVVQYREMLKRDDNDWNSHYGLGRILIRQGREEEGNRELQKVEQIRQEQREQKTAAEMVSLGAAALNQGKLEEAMKKFNAALETDKTSLEARMYLGIALAAAGHLDEGIEKLNEAVRIEPSSPKAHHNLGTLLMQAGRMDLAQREFERALELDPYFPEAHNNLGLILSKSNQLKNAIGHFRTASELNPQYLEALFNLGLALRSDNQVEAAAQVFRQAAEVAPDNAQVQYALGMTLKDKGDLAGAKQALDRANQLQRRAGSNANDQREER